MEFKDLTIENGYSQENVIYFLNEENSIYNFRETTKKIVYLLQRHSLSTAIVVKKWYEKGKIRNFKNYVQGGSRAVREAKNMLILRKSGIGIPPIISYGNYRDKDREGYFSFIITEQLEGIQTYHEMVKKYNLHEYQEDKFFSETDGIIKEIAKMHLNGITHHDLHTHNILIRNSSADNTDIYFLDTLAVKKRKNNCFYCLIDMAKFYFWMQNDPTGIILHQDEREYILQRYYHKTKKIYPFKYSIFKFFIINFSFFIKKTYKLTRSIRSIQ